MSSAFQPQDSLRRSPEVKRFKKGCKIGGHFTVEIERNDK